MRAQPLMLHFTGDCRAALVCAMALELLLCFGGNCLDAVESRPVVDQPRFALLIGVQDYPKLGTGNQLKGCRNDVEAMKKLLVDRFCFHTEDIVTLVDSQATSTAIRQQLKSTIDQVRSLPASGSRPEVVFYFSGHGSLMPDQPEGDPDCDKLDGVDETLVPYDAETQGGPQDIRDDEVHHFVEAVCNEGAASTLVILDCCHSGRGVRGATRFRGLERDLSIPPPVSGGERKVTPKSWPSGAVILTACRKAEKEQEYDEGDSSHGLMTRFLVELLNTENALSQLDYETLRLALMRRYQDARLGLAAPTPTLEGKPELLRGSVLGANSQLDHQPYWPAEASELDRGTVWLQAGLLHGVTKGSLYELYVKPEQIIWHSHQAKSEENTSSAWLRIESVESTTATGTVFEWEGPERQDQVESVLPREFKKGFAVERRRSRGSYFARVRVVKAIDENDDGAPLGPSDREVPSVIRETLEAGNSGNGSAWFTWVEGYSPCDVLLRIDGDYAALFPAIGWADRPNTPTEEQGSVPASLAGGWSPVDLRDPTRARSDLVEALRRITHAGEVLKNATQASLAEGSPIHLEADVMRVTTEKEGDAYAIREFHDWPKQVPLVLKNGQDFVVRVKNVSTDGKPVYVTILFLDPDMEIQCMLPDRYVQGEADSQQRLEAGADRRVTPPWRCTSPFGPHRILVYATQEPSNFAFLAQPSLRRMRGTNQEASFATILPFDVCP